MGSFPVAYDNFINHGFISDLGATINANYFENGGTFANNSLGSFNLQSLTTVLTNGSLTAGGDIVITTGSLVASNLMLHAGRSLALQVTTNLTDTGPANGNVWSVGGAGLVGLNLPIKPLAGDLLGTTITVYTPPGLNKQVVNTWAGLDYGAATTAGYTNNEAIGVLILDAQGAGSTFKFNGIPGTNNALYVDELVLLDSATNFNGSQVFALNISTNMVIYYAQAMVNGVSVAEKLNHLNGNRLLWVTNYAGHFSSTNVVFPDSTIYPFNVALAESQDIDSDGDGIPNGSDPTPFGNIGHTASFYVLGNVTITMTNKPVLAAVLTWQSITNATNYVVYYKTNFTMTNWLPLLTNTASPTSPPVTMRITDPVAGPMRSYRVRGNLKQ